MKILIYTLALISAFFVSAQNESTGLCLVFKTGVETPMAESACKDIATVFDPPYDSDYYKPQTNWGRVINSHDTVYNGFPAVEYLMSCRRCGAGLSDVQMSPKAMFYYGDIPEPPPDPDDDSCDEFGDNSFLPPKTGLDVPDGGSVCYTTSTGKQCKYSKNDFGDGYTQTGQQCSGEEPPYGEPQTPPDNECAVVGSLEFFAVCPVDPNEACNPLTVNNDVVYQCPTGCGSINGEYVCVHEDKNANGIPDKDETDPDPENPDPENPDPENPDPNNPTDLTQTNNLINGLGGKLDGIGGTLDGIKLGVSDSNELLGGLNTKLSDISVKQDATNQILGNINNSSSLIAGNTDAIAGNTKGILEALEPSKIQSTFNPDSSSSFYESSYENGFEGVWEEKSIAFKQTETFLFLEQFKFNAGGSAPDTQMCFNLGGSMDFGCAELPTPSPQLLAIIRVFILITAAFLCRALIFGG